MSPNEITIAIDLGHGTNTYELKRSKFVIVNGKVYEEHDFNSKVGIELDKILKSHGFKTIMYQKAFSPEISLTQRINYYNNIGVNLVCSIHANAGVASAKGMAAFYWYTSKESKRLADLYAEEVKSAGFETYGSGSRESVPKTWSEFAICRDSDMVAILSENGFMTNPDDFKLIFQSEKYIKDVAEIHAKAICKFYGVTYKDANVIVANQPKPEIKETTEPNLEDVMGMEISKFINEGDMIRLETVYRYARVDGYLSDDSWEKKCADKSIKIAEVCYLASLLDHRRHGDTKIKIAELTKQLEELKSN